MTLKQSSEELMQGCLMFPKKNKLCGSEDSEYCDSCKARIAERLKVLDEVSETIRIMLSAWWAGTDYVVEDKENKDLEEYSTRLLNAFNNYIVKEISEAQDTLRVQDILRGKK